MPFNHLLFEALIPGKTTAEDRKNKGRTSAELRPAPDEAVLLFRLDDSVTRDRLALAGAPCCDHLFLYKSPTKALLIFVELKGADLGSAPEQLLNAIHAICDRAPHGRSWRKLARAVIVAPTFLPQETRTIQREMKKLRVEVFFGICKPRSTCDIKSIDRLANDFR